MEKSTQLRNNMNSVELEELTNAQLIADYIEPANIEIKNPKVANKPNKSEIIAAILEHRAKSDAIKKERMGDTIPVNDATKANLKPGVVLKPQTKLELMRKELMLKDRVIIHDQQERQTKEETITVSWGNRGIGTFTDLVSLGGEPQYVRRGALNNLKDATTVIQIPKANGGVAKEVRKRFVIQRVEGLTQKELDELAAQQAMRNSKHA